MAANTASGQGQAPTSKPRTRLERFHTTWSTKHKKAALAAIGLTLDDFRAMGHKDQHHTVNRAVEAVAKLRGNKQGGSGGGGGSAPNNDPAFFTRPLGQAGAERLANQQVQLQYGPDQQVLQQQAANIPNWFDQYRTSLSQQQTQQHQMNAPLIAQAQQRSQNTGQVTAGIDPTSEAGRNDALAAQARSALSGAFADLLGVNEQTMNQYLAGRTEVANQAQQQATTDNTTARRQLAQQMGLARSTNLAAIRDAERKNQLENAAFNLNIDQAQVSADDKAADNARADATLRETRRKNRNLESAKGQAINAHGYTAAEWSAMSNGQRRSILAKDKRSGGGVDGVLTPKEAEKNTDQWKRARSLAKSVGGANFKNVGEMYDFLLSENQTLDPDIVRAAAEFQFTKKLSPATRKALRAMGVKLPKVIKRAQTLPGTTGNAAYGNGQNRPG